MPAWPPTDRFFGPWVVRATFVMALFGWGLGFYGPPIFMHAVMQRSGWPLVLVSAAVTLHHVSGALVVLRLPGLHRRHGVGPVALLGAGVSALGVLAWSLAASPWQLYAGAVLSGAGWATMGAVAVNAAVAPWYVRGRPLALAKAYNGATVGGVLFSPLWAWLIVQVGFGQAALVVGLSCVLVMALLSRAVLAWTPDRLGQRADGDVAAIGDGIATPAPQAQPGRLPHWNDRAFITLAVAMAAGLFAQVGLLAHLFALLAPAFGARAAGLVLGLATACALAGRLAVARVLPAGAGRRRVAALCYAVQLAGTLLVASADGTQAAPILLGVALFGSGIGNATSLPPLIAQAEFDAAAVPRAVARMVALAQGSYAFAPLAFGLLLGASGDGAVRIGAGSGPFLLAVAGAQALAMLCLLAGPGREPAARTGPN